MRGNTSSQLIVLVFQLALSAPSPATDPATIANQGAGGVVACASCHGKDGGGQASFPRLAGINAAYLLKQMQDFASGSRMALNMPLPCRISIYQDGDKTIVGMIPPTDVLKLVSDDPRIEPAARQVEAAMEKIIDSAL